jgi:hypothetical protein
VAPESQKNETSPRRSIALSNEKTFTPPAKIAAATPAKPTDTSVVRQANLEEPLAVKQPTPVETRAAALKAGNVPLPSEQAKANVEPEARPPQPRPKSDKGLAAHLDEDPLLPAGARASEAAAKPLDPMTLPQPRNEDP